MGMKAAVVGFVAGAAVAGLVAAGVASAAIPSASGGVVTACVNKASGAVRIIDAEARRRCTSAERTVTWARDVARGGWSSRAVYAAGDTVQFGGSTWQARRASKGRAPAARAYWTLLAAAGAPGPQGAQGPQGPQGPQGVQGPAGPSLGTYAEGLHGIGTPLAGSPVVVAATDAYQTGPSVSGAWFGALGFPANSALMVSAAVEVRTSGSGAYTCELQGSIAGAAYSTRSVASSSEDVLRFTHPFIRFASATVAGAPEHYRVVCTSAAARLVLRGSMTVTATLRSYA